MQDRFAVQEESLSRSLSSSDRAKANIPPEGLILDGIDLEEADHGLITVDQVEKQEEIQQIMEEALLQESPPSQDTSLDWGEETLLTVDQVVAQHKRSEERRVGKECRSRWSPSH